MSILPQLMRIYSDQGMTPLSGYNSHHFFDWRDAPFTVFLKNGGIEGCPGLALQEVMFMEHLGTYLSPANCLVIGNAMGWSTLACALTFPQAKTIGMDNAATDGIDFTNRAFAALELTGGAVLGSSPGDVGAVVDEHLGGSLDFVLIDAIHDNEAIQADFHAARAKAGPNCVFLFHDVINWNMLEGFTALLKSSGLEGHLLTRTPSGMAIAFGPGLPQACRDYISVFTDTPALFRQYRHTVRQNFDRLAFFDQQIPE